MIRRQPPNFPRLRRAPTSLDRPRLRQRRRGGDGLPRWLARKRRAACEAAGGELKRHTHGGGRAPHAALLARAASATHAPPLRISAADASALGSQIPAGPHTAGERFLKTNKKSRWSSLSWWLPCSMSAQTGTNSVSRSWLVYLPVCYSASARQSRARCYPRGSFVVGRYCWQIKTQSSHRITVCCEIRGESSYSSPAVTTIWRPGARPGKHRRPAARP